MKKKRLRQFRVMGSFLLFLLIVKDVFAADVTPLQAEETLIQQVSTLVSAGVQPHSEADDLMIMTRSRRGFNTVAAQTAVCGNGILESGETCDDNNTNDSDGCSASCQIENGWACTDPTIGMLTLDEGFENGTVPPTGWTTQITNAAYTWKLNAIPSEANTGSYATDILFDPGLALQDEWLISPAITPSAASRLYFASKGSPSVCRDTVDNCDVEVWALVGAFGGGDDVQLGLADDAWPAAPAYVWAESSFDIPDSGPYSIAFRYIGSDGAQAFLDDIQVGEPVPSSCMPIVPDGLELGCNLPTIGFESGIPANWQVIDNAGNGVVWTDVASSGESGNFTGGVGEAASVSRDYTDSAIYDTELRSNIFDLAPATTTVTLTYQANFQHYSAYPDIVGSEVLDLDISTDGGINWITLQSWMEDHGSFRAIPGESVSTSLSAYAGQNNLMLRWRYYDPASNDPADFDLYAQIDEVSLTCDTTTGEAVDFSDLGNNADVAWHEEPVTGRTLWLGATVDNDPNALSSTDNTSDDGVTLTSRWLKGEDATMDIEVSGANGHLSAWVDWGNDGFDVGDLILDQAVVVGTNATTFPILDSYKTGTTVDVRFRLTTVNVGASGLAVDGEVEDYVFYFTPTAVSLSSFSAQNPTSTFDLFILFGVPLIVLSSWFVYKRE